MILILENCIVNIQYQMLCLHKHSVPGCTGKKMLWIHQQISRQSQEKSPSLAEETWKFDISPVWSEENHYTSPASSVKGRSWWAKNPTVKGAMRKQLQSEEGGWLTTQTLQASASLVNDPNPGLTFSLLGTGLYSMQRGADILRWFYSNHLSTSHCPLTN